MWRRLDRNECFVLGRMWFRSCPGYVSRPWRVRKEYVIYSYVDDKERERELIKRHSGNGHGKRLTNDLRPKRVSHNGSNYHGESNQQRHNDDDDAISNETLEEKDCLHAFQAVYHELQLIRTVRRSLHADLIKLPTLDQKKLHLKLSAQDSSAQVYLYLGEIHPQLEHRASYRPTAYQPPLVRHHEVKLTQFQWNFHHGFFSCLAIIVWKRAV